MVLISRQELNDIVEGVHDLKERQSLMMDRIESFMLSTRAELQKINEKLDVIQYGEIHQANLERPNKIGNAEELNEAELNMIKMNSEYVEDYSKLVCLN